MTFFTARGGSTNEGRMTINGMVVAASFNGGGVSSLAYDANNVDEVSVVVAGGLGDTDVGGPVMNLVPRTGGRGHGEPRQPACPGHHPPTVKPALAADRIRRPCGRSGRSRCVTTDMLAG